MIPKRLRKPARQFITWSGGWLWPLPRPEKWLFIAGCYNSGTSLLHTILAHHPNIGSMPREGQLCTNQLLIPKSVGLTRLWALEPDRFRLDRTNQSAIQPTRLKKQWATWMNNSKRPILMEKTPANVARLSWLQANFENAYFLGIIRNGYAVAEGIRRKAGHSLELGAQQWFCSNQIMLSAFEALDHRLLVSYEALTDSPTATLAEIMSFLELSSDELGSIKEQTWSIHNVESKLVNMNGRSLEALTDEEKTVIENVAGDLLTNLGYQLRFV